MSGQIASTDTTQDDALERSVLAIVQDTYSDLHDGETRSISLDDHLDRDLRFDSLARVELLSRVSAHFDLQISEQTLAQIETPRDLIAAVRARTPFAPDRITPAPSAKAQPEVITVPSEANTLVEVLRWHVRHHPELAQIVVLSDTGAQTIHYRGLHEKACTLAAGLSAIGVRKGQTVALMLPTSPDYFYTYYGVLYAGGIPVPLYPPARPSQIEEHVQRHTHILENAQATVLITVQEALPIAKLLRAASPHLRTVTTVAALTENGGTFEPLPAKAGDIALIQYTSGSTGDPKGVVLRHANLLANIRAMGEALAVTANDVFVSWLPLYHDMGLISAWLGTQYFGFPLVVMSPLAFLAQPVKWLRVIQEYRGTLTAAPNFAYELCLTKISDDQVQGLDVSSLRFAANGSEAVSPDTIDKFTRRFAAHGFRPTAMVPVYGLAECSVDLLCPALNRLPIVDNVDRATFAQRHIAMPASADDTSALRFVACGKPLSGHEIRIVDDSGALVGERIEGQLEFRGPSATEGYFNNAEATQNLLHEGWLKTGDRAYTAGADVYITGRVKDIIIRRGRNIYPQEIEEAAGAIRGIRKGCVAAFGCQDPVRGTERLIIVAETVQTDTAMTAALRDEVSKATIETLGEPPDEVVLAPPHTVLKTSSGKIRRAATKALYESGLIGAPRRAVWRQMARLTLSAWRSRVARFGLESVRAPYGLFAGLVAMFFAIVAGAVTTILTSPKIAWRVNQHFARAFFLLAGIKIRVTGIEHLKAERQYVVVANHGSYLDGLVLMAVMPPLRFVAKRELEENRLYGLYLRHIGSVFIERFAVEQSLKDAERLVELAHKGDCLAFFPEGTFHREPGLLPFRLGAFHVAVNADLSIIPVTIVGTRTILPDDEWLMRRGAIAVTVSSPLRADLSRNKLLAAIALRDQTRAEILKHCNEPNIQP